MGVRKVNNLRENTEKRENWKSVHGKFQVLQEAAANMSHSLFQQPENLTKDRLKAELKHVAFDPNENKDYYVRLYRSKVGSTGRRQRSERLQTKNSSAGALVLAPRSNQ